MSLRSLLAGLAGLFLLVSPAVAGPPSDAAMIAQFRERKAEFEKLKDYLIKTNTKVFGPGYGEYAALRKSLGIKRYYVTDRGTAAFRFPTYLAPAWIQYLPSTSKGYAYLPPTPNFPNYPGAPYMVDPNEPKTQWFTAETLDTFKPAMPNKYFIVIRRIEGNWYLYADNNPYRRSW